MKRLFASALLFTSCAQANLSQEPKSCPAPYSAPKTVAPKAPPKVTIFPAEEMPPFVAPQQWLFARDPNNFDGTTSATQCELPGRGVSLSFSSQEAQGGHKTIRVETPTGESQVDCTIHDIEAWDVGIRYQCPTFTLDEIGGDGSTEFHLKGKIDNKKIDAREFVSGSSSSQMSCSFAHSVYTNKLSEVEALMTCPIDTDATVDETRISSAYEVSFATTKSGESALTVMRHGDGDIGMYYAIPCEKKGGLFSCEGTLWPLEVYKESLPEPERGFQVKIMIEEQKGVYFMTGTVDEGALKMSACMSFGGF